MDHPGRPHIEQKAIGAYLIGKSIGEGTFGKVKLGIHATTKQKVAIKILEKKKICDVADVERVSRELHILKLIRHPHIIQLYEIIETPKKLYLIMEYANGGELFDFIVENTRIKEKLACKFFQQLIAGIEYIHKLGVAHRDLKPENLLLDAIENIKIVDFGLSNTYCETELLKTACGSPCYAAPEMIAGKKYEGLKADIWSAGVILFAMTCGYLPFEDPDTSKLYKKILAGAYECPSFVSKHVRDLINRILVTDPEQRMTIEEIRDHVWCAQSKQEFSNGILVGYDNILVDREILDSLAKFGYDLDHTHKCIEANKHNNITAAYYLLLKSHIQNGGQSVADYSLLAEPHSPFRKPSNTLNQTLPYTPHPPLFKLSEGRGHPFHNRVRKYAKVTRRSSSRKSAAKSTDNARVRRQSVDLRAASALKKPPTGKLKVATPRPPSKRTPTTRKGRVKTPGLQESLDSSALFQFNSRTLDRKNYRNSRFSM